MIKRFLSARWQYLAMLNYQIDPDVLRRYIPPFTEIDYWNGKAVISVVGFLFHDTSVLGVKWPGHVNFEEVNLRYYIKHYDGAQWRRGVGFISEIVPRSAICAIANRWYNEHYTLAKMAHALAVSKEEVHISYQWQKRGGMQNELGIYAAGPLRDILPGTEEDFIFEHYYGYNKLRDGVTIEYGVHHPRWKVFDVKSHSLVCDAEALYGPDFAPFINDSNFLSAFLAVGSDVWVGWPRYIRSPQGITLPQ